MSNHLSQFLAVTETQLMSMLWKHREKRDSHLTKTSAPAAKPEPAPVAKGPTRKNKHS